MNVRAISVLIVLALVLSAAAYNSVMENDEDNGKNVKLAVHGVDDGAVLAGEVELDIDGSPAGGIVTIAIEGITVYQGSSTSWTWDTELFPDGAYDITVTYSKGGNQRSSSYVVTIANGDPASPTCNIVSPSSGYHTSLDSVDFTVGDLDDDLETIKLDIDGYLDIIAISGTSYFIPVDLEDGEHTVTLTVIDSNDQEATDTVTFILDTTAPSLSISPMKGWHRPPVTFTWSASDAIGLDEVVLTIDDEEVYSGTGSQYEFNGSDGEHDVEVVATDLAGNTKTESFTIGLDGTAPAVSLDLEDGSYLSGEVEITGDIDEEEIADSWLTIDGVEVAQDLPYDLDTEDYDDGTHSIVWGCEDKTETISEVSVDVVFDNTAPEVSLDLEDGQYLTGKVEVNGTAEDAIGIDTSWLEVDGDPVTDALPFTLDTEDYDDDDHIITWGCADLAGNEVEIEVLVTTDNTLPDIGIDLVEASYVRGDIEITGYASDDEINNTWLIMDGEEVSDSLPYDVDTTDHEDGPHTFIWGCDDKAGNVAEMTVHVYFDNTDPELELYVPDGILRGLALILVDAEDSLKLEMYGFLIDEETPVLDGGYVDTTAYSDGEHTIQAIAEDAAGNVAELDHNVTFDNTPPDVEIILPVDEYVRGTIDVEIDAEDEFGIGTINISIDGEELTNTTSAELDTTELSDGEHTINATVIDDAGNVGWHEITITVDNTLPEISDVEPTHGERVRDTVTVSFTVEDESPLDSVGIYVDGDLEASNTTWEWDTTVHDDGWTDVALRAEDAAGNVATYEFSVQIDNVDPPTVYVEWPVEGMAFNEEFTLTINVTSDLEVDETRLVIDDGTPDVYSGLQEEFIIDTTAYADGPHNINITIVDTDSNVNWTEVNLTFDNTVPDLSWIRPDDDRMDNVTLEVDASDATTGIDWICFMINGTEVANGTEVNNTDWYDWRPDGPMDIGAMACDRVGNYVVIEMDVWLDMHAPKVMFATPENDTILRRTHEVEVWRYDYDIEEIHLYLNDELIDDVYEWTWDTTEYDDGEYWLNFTAIDKWDQQTDIALHLGVDNTPPEIRWESPMDYYLSGEVSMIADVYDEYIVRNVTFALDDSVVQNGTGEIWVWDTTTASSGEHEIEVIGIDKAGNWNSTSVWFYIDNTPPEVSIESPDDGELVNGTVDIEVDATDNIEVASVMIFVNNDLMGFLNATPYDVEWDSDDYPDGNYTITAIAEDIAGNIASEAIKVTKGEERDTVVTEPTVKVLDEYDLFGIERVIVTDSRYQAAPITSTLIPYGILPSIEWEKNNATDMWINYTSTVSEFSSRMAISVWDSPDYAIVVDDYESAILSVPLSVYLDAPLLMDGTTTDEALWELGTIYADQIICVGTTQYNNDGVTVIDEDDVMEYALGIAILNGETPDYLVVTNPDDADGNTAYLSSMAGAFAAYHRGVILTIGSTDTSTVINTKIHDAYDVFTDIGLNCTYLNIVGDYKSVPHKYENHGFGNEPSDNRYADLDGDPVTIEIAAGRVFGKTLEDVAYYLDRVINYESYWDTDTAPVAPAPALVPGQWNNNAVIYCGWAAEFAEDSENHCREYMRNIGWFNTKDDSEVAHAMATAQLMADFAASNFIIINADHGMPTGTVTFDSGDLLDLHPSVVFGVSCSVGRTDGVNKQNSLTYTFLEKGAVAWLAPTRTAYGSFIQTYPYQPIAAPGLCYLYLRELIDNNLTSGEAYMRAKNGLIDQADSNVNKGTTWQYQHYGDPKFNPYEPNHEGWWF